MIAKVSIIIPFYNCSYVNQAIQSCLNQTYKNIEIIVVDDGSTLFTEKLDPFRKKIKYIRKENGGTATALNLGIRSATGEYFAWLSSDDCFLSEKIAKQMKFMLNHKADVSFTNYDYIDKDNNISLPFVGKRFSNVKEIYQDFFEVNPVNGCTVIMKKKIFDHIGYFNPDLLYTHDYDMWFRLLLNGYIMHYLDESLTRFRSHEESGTKKFQPQIKKEITAVKSYHHPRLREYIKHLN